MDLKDKVLELIGGAEPVEIARLLENLGKIEQAGDLKLGSFNKLRGNNLKRCLINDSQGARELSFSNDIRDYYLEDEHEFHKHVLLSTNETALKGFFTCYQWISTNIGRSTLEQSLKKTGHVLLSKETHEWYKNKLKEIENKDKHIKELKSELANVKISLQRAEHYDGDVQ